MTIVHLECKPDELLIKKLGVARKNIEHHDDKSRVYNALKKNNSCFAIVDEDPDPSTTISKYTYESELIFIEEKYGIKRYFDNKRNNTVLELKTKLEDWVISICKESKVDITQSPYSLPDKGNSLHKVINDRLYAYERLLDDLIKKKNKPLQILKEWLSISK